MGKRWDPVFFFGALISWVLRCVLVRGIVYPLQTGFGQEGFYWARVHTSVKANPLFLLFIIRGYQNWAEERAGIGQYVICLLCRARHQHHMESKQCYCAFKSLVPINYCSFDRV